MCLHVLYNFILLANGYQTAKHMPHIFQLPCMLVFILRLILGPKNELIMWLLLILPLFRYQYFKEFFSAKLEKWKT